MPDEQQSRAREAATTIAVLASIGLGLFFSAAGAVFLVIELAHLVGLPLSGSECPTHELGVGKAIIASVSCGAIGAFFLVGAPHQVGERIVDGIAAAFGRLFGGGS